MGSKCRQSPENTCTHVMPSRAGPPDMRPTARISCTSGCPSSTVAGARSVRLHQSSFSELLVLQQQPNRVHNHGHTLFLPTNLPPPFVVRSASARTLPTPIHLEPLTHCCCCKDGSYEHQQNGAAPRNGTAHLLVQLDPDCRQGVGRKDIRYRQQGETSIRDTLTMADCHWERAELTRAPI